MINFSDYKDLQKAKLIHTELLAIKERLNNCIESLKGYSKYIPVKESLSTLKNSHTLIEININKFKRMIEPK